MQATRSRTKQRPAGTHKFAGRLHTGLRGAVIVAPGGSVAIMIGRHPGEARGDAGGQPDDIETRLRAALRDAMKTRDVVAVFALRSALSAIGNAGAIPAGPDPAPGAGPRGRPPVRGRARGGGWCHRRLHGEASAKCFIASSVNFPVRHEPVVTVMPAYDAENSRAAARRADRRSDP